MYKLWAIALLAMVAACGLGSAATAGTITGAHGGTKPPGFFANFFSLYTMTPFGDDSRNLFEDVSTVPSPLGGDLAFGTNVNHLKVNGTSSTGNSQAGGWATWGSQNIGDDGIPNPNDYFGDVYYSNGSQSLTMTLPAHTVGFYFYAEPQPFDLFDMTASAKDGPTVTQKINGNSGASFFGFFTNDESTKPLTTITISIDTEVTTVGFAVGEFGIAMSNVVAPVPLPAAAWMGLALLGGIGGVGAFRRRAL